MSVSPLTTEQQLLIDLQDPVTQESAFARLVRLYQEPLYWHVRRMVTNHDDADDVLQTTFIKAWRSIGGFRGESKLKTWLFRIATNESLTHLEKLKRQAADSIDGMENRSELSHGGHEGLDGDAMVRMLELAVEKLPDKQRQVFVMKYYDELTYEEMADVLGGTVGSLKASFHHAVKKIEQFLVGD